MIIKTTKEILQDAGLRELAGKNPQNDIKYLSTRWANVDGIKDELKERISEYILGSPSDNLRQIVEIDLNRIIDEVLK